MATRAAADGESRRAALVVALLLLANLAVFGRAVGFDFVHLDDDTFLVKNPVVQRGLTADGVAWAFTTFSPGAVWHPLVWISHLADVELHGMRPGGHHATNVLLHAANALLLFILARRFTGATVAAGFVAALFSLHPLRVESVAWIVERKDVLSGTFFLLTVLAYTRYADRPSPGRYAAVAAAYAAALMSKAVVVTLPAVLLLLDFWPLRRFDASPPWRLVREKLPLVALAAAAAIPFALAQERSLIESEGGWLARAGHAALAYLRYLETTVYPHGLAAHYPFDPAIPPFRLAIAIALLAGITAAAVLLRRRLPALLAGWGWFVVILAPLSGVLRIGMSEAAADRYTYLPSIGLAIAAVELARRLPRPRAVAAVGAAAVVALGASAWRQTGTWRNSETLFTHALAVTKDNDLAHYNLATALGQQGRYDEAIPHYEAALRINPRYVGANDNLGLIALSRGDVAGAERRFRAEIDVDPRSAGPRSHLGVALARAGRLDDAVLSFGEAIRLDPTLADAWYNLGLAKATLGRPAEAVEPLSRALALAPDCADCAYQLAEALGASGQGQRAIALLREVVRRWPDHPNAAARLREVGGAP